MARPDAKGGIALLQQPIAEATELVTLKPIALTPRSAVAPKA
jgi:hypothetical protein